MKTGEYATARLVVSHPDGYKETKVLSKVSMQIHACGFVELIYYMGGEKIPKNKRTLILPTASLVSFGAEGYAN